MTTDHQPTQEDRPIDHPGLKNAIADHHEKLVAHGQAFEQAIAETQTLDKRIAEFNAQIDASKMAADEVSKKIRAQYKSEGTGAREAVKLKAQRRANLEEVEDFQWIVQDATREKARAELPAICAANEYLVAADAVLRKADSYLESVLIESLPVELRMFIQIKVEVAQRGLSDLYGADPTVKTPIEFALRELANRLRVEFKSPNPAYGIGGFLPPYPESICSYKKSPLEIKKIKDELAALEGEQ
jgi:hypothetical protein